MRCRRGRLIRRLGGDHARSTKRSSTRLPRSCGARTIRALPSRWHHRERQDRGLSRSRRACIAAGRQALLLVPEINLTPQFAQRIARALPGRRAVLLHSRLPAALRRRHWRAAAAGEPDLVARHAARGLRADAASRARRRRRGARRLVQATGRRSLPRARRRGLARAAAGRPDRARHRDAVARIASSGAARSLRASRAAGAGDRDAATPPGRACAASRSRGSRGYRHAAARRDRSAARARAAIARLHQPSRLRAIAHVRFMRLAGRVRALQRAPCRASRRGARPLPSLRARRAAAVGLSRMRQRRPHAARLRNAAARACADGAAFRRRGSRASIATARGARASLPMSASEWMPGTSTSSSARRCWRRGTISRASRWSACWAPTTRSTAPIFAPPSASRRCCSRSPAARGARRCPAKSIVQTDFPEHPLYRALAVNDYGAFAASLLAERRAASLPPFAHLALVTAEAPARDAVDAFLTRCARRGTMRPRGMGGDESRCSRRCRRRSPVERALERGQVVAQSEDRGALQRFLPGWRSAIEALPGRRVRLALDVDPAGFA